MQDFLAGAYPYLKSLHVIAVIAWFAGMMYLPRLFIYHHQSIAGGEAEGYFVAMERRLMKGIMNPSIAAVWLLALMMLWANPGLLKAGWFHLKLPLVAGISAIHGFYAIAQKRFANGERVRSEKFWRIINELPFVMLIAVVVLALAKPF
ncbi:MAG: TIGR00701 family protein [Alphaproteobacteria bacterium]|nr:TIGR00701 family protein [Alphaproteobacteria bacterium]